MINCSRFAGSRQPAITVYRKQIYLTRQYIFASNMFTHITIVVHLFTKYSLSVPVLQLDLSKWALVPRHTKQHNEYDTSK